MFVFGCLVPEVFGGAPQAPPLRRSREEGVEMDKAIAKCGVLMRNEGRLRRNMSRRYALTNQGGLFEVQDSADKFDFLKPFMNLCGNAKVTMQKAGSVSPGNASHVIKIHTRGRRYTTEFGATSDSEIMSWYKVLQDVIGLIRAINGDEEAPAQSKPTIGRRIGDEGWYSEATGRVGLYMRLHEHRTMKREDASLPIRTKQQVEVSRSSEESNATQTTALENVDEECDEQKEVRRMMGEHASQLEKCNQEWEEKVRALRRENASLSTALEEQVGISWSLGARNATLTSELKKSNRDWDYEIRAMESKCATLSATVKRQLEDETKCFEIAKNDLKKEKEQQALRIARLEADMNNTWASLGSLVSLPERSRQALGSIASNLESVLEECFICCELLLSGIGTPSFGLMSYSCGCGQAGHVRTLHVNCIVSMSNLKCPLCGNEIVLIAPTLMSPTAVRTFTVRKR